MSPCVIPCYKTIPIKISVCAQDDNFSGFNRFLEKVINPGPDQGVRRLVQVQEPEYLGGIWSGTTGETDASGVLEQIHDGGKGGRVLRDWIQGREGRDTGRPTVTHHLQCGGGCGGPPLCHASLSLESGPVITSRPCHHRGFDLVRPQHPSRLLSHPVSLQDLQ